MLVVGGGEVALRKVTLLERAGARITVVAPEIAPELDAARRARRAELGVPRIRAGRFGRCAARDRRDVAPRGESLDRQPERRARHPRERGRRSRSLALHRAGDHRSRPGAGRGLDRRVPRRSWRAACASAWRRSFRSAWAIWHRGCAICARPAADGCAIPRSGGGISRPSSTVPQRAASSTAIGAARSASPSNCWRPRHRAARRGRGDSGGRGSRRSRIADA